ncbi:MAG: integrase arm-type DNA-binding domain-containing protein [Henriciella sp.]
MPLTVRQITFLPAGKYELGRGLRLVKRNEKAGKWVFRYRLFGRRPEMGLGGWPAVSLGGAREKADAARQLVANGIDPMQERSKGSADTKHLFEDVMQEAFESHKKSLRGDGKAGRWLSPLEQHVVPKIGKMPITMIDQNVIRDALKPIWHSKAPTAIKALNRTGIVFRHAAAMGLDVDVTATTKAKALLGVQEHKTKGIPMMPWAEVPAFYSSIVAPDPEDQAETVTKLCLRMLILCGIRSKAVRLMNLSEIDGDIWTAPGPHLKGGKDKTPDFRVPVTTEMRNVMEACKPFMRADGYLFPGRTKGVISDVVTSRYMAKRDLEARPHGFRKSLRTWASQATDLDWRVGEMLIEHDKRDAVAKTYDLDDYLERRAPVLERWGEYVAGRSSGEVLKLVRGG